MKKVTSFKDQPSVENTKEAIIKKRVVFVWLPVAYSNDIEHGSIWYFWGSVLTILIPIFPLISLYEDLWPNDEMVIEIVSYHVELTMWNCDTSHLVHVGSSSSSIGNLLSPRFRWNTVLAGLMAIRSSNKNANTAPHFQRFVSLSNRRVVCNVVLLVVSEIALP